MKTSVLSTRVECYDDELGDSIFTMDVVDEHCIEIKLHNICYSEATFNKLIEDLQAAFNKLDVYKEIKDV